MPGMCTHTRRQQWVRISSSCCWRHAHTAQLTSKPALDVASSGVFLLSDTPPPTLTFSPNVLCNWQSPGESPLSACRYARSASALNCVSPTCAMYMYGALASTNTIDAKEDKDYNIKITITSDVRTGTFTIHASSTERVTLMPMSGQKL